MYTNRFKIIFSPIHLYYLLNIMHLNIFFSAMLVTFALAWTTYRKHYNFVKWHESNVVFSHQGIEQFYSSMVAQKMGIVGVVLSTHRLFFFPKQQFLIYWLRREKKLVCPLHQIQWCWRHMPPLSYILILVNLTKICNQITV